MRRDTFCRYGLAVLSQEFAMVNGKPQLTFGGVTPGQASSRQRTAPALRGGEPFASYLPAGADSPRMGRTGAPDAQEHARNLAALQSRGAAAPQNARMFLGFLPDNYISPQSPNRMTGQQGMPPGGQTLAQASPLALPGAGGVPNRFGTKGAEQRLSAKTTPHLSGAPISGRGGFGMVDTRRSAVQPRERQAAVAARSTAPHSAPPAGSGQYAEFAAHYGGAPSVQSRQSFVAYGFASKNAELTLKTLGYDLKRPPSLNTYARRLEPDPYELNSAAAATERGMTFGSTRPVRFPSGEDAARTALLAASHRRKGGQAGTSLAPGFRSQAEQGLGRLAAKFESGEEGLAAVGYDRKGGTSYGTYQIASRVGTMRAFIDYLDEKAPDIGRRLAAAGPANTGGRRGRMPDEWRKIAAEDPDRFEELQSDFIRTSHFEPAKEAIAAATGVFFDNMPAALQEVLFSTAVQHGPVGATRIVSQALRRIGSNRVGDGTGLSKKAEQQLITHIYNLRAGQFISSTSDVQMAVRQRLKQEMREALQMLA